MLLRISWWGGLALIAVGLVFWNPLARIAADYSQDVTVGSASIYATLRTANAVMSVAKDANLQGSVGVLSVEGSPGQVLQPVTNTIDRLADLLFALAIVSGIVSAVLVPISKVSALVLASISGVTAITVATRMKMPSAVQNTLRQLLFVGVLGAIAVPFAYTVAFYTGNHITADAWNHASEVMNRLGQAYDETTLDEQLDTLPVTAAVQTQPVTSVEPVAPDGRNQAEGGIFRNGLAVFGSAVEASRSAIGGTVEAATKLTASVTGNITSQTKAIRDGLSLSSDLFSASLQIAVSYLVKLIVLPILVLAALSIVLRSAFNGPTHSL